MKLGKFLEFTNPITKEGMRALAIVLGVLVVIAAVVYAVNFGQRKESTIVTTPQPTITTKVPTITPLKKEEKFLASPSSTIKVLKPTGILTPAVKEATVSPTLIK